MNGEDKKPQPPTSQSNNAPPPQAQPKPTFTRQIYTDDLGIGLSYLETCEVRAGTVVGVGCTVTFSRTGEFTIKIDLDGKR